MYITDLDNTLLDGKGLLSEYAKKSISKFDFPFTFATARSLFTAGVVLSFVDVRYPVILSNGAVIYDTVNKKYLHKEGIPKEVFHEVIQKSITNPFVLGIHNDKEILFHRKSELDVQQSYLDSRLTYNDTRQTLVEEYPTIDTYISMIYLDVLEKIDYMYELLKDYEELNVFKYPKRSGNQEYFYLEINSKYATKGNAVIKLCDMLNVDIKDVTAFGDDVNDLSMLDIVGKPYMMKDSMIRGYPVVGDNKEDAVIKHIEEEELKIIKVDSLTYDLDELVEDSRVEDYNFVRRLRDEYQTGYNAFNRSGEVLYLAVIGERVVGSCGLNIDPYLKESHIGRVRHLYVLQKYRRSGVATRLLTEVLEHSKEHFSLITLRTFSEEASKLYVKNGFTRSNKFDYATHYIDRRII